MVQFILAGLLSHTLQPLCLPALHKPWLALVIVLPLYKPLIVLLLCRSSFPYTHCLNGTAPYSLYLASVAPRGTGQQFCFGFRGESMCSTLQNTIAYECCNVLMGSLHKLELQADPICVKAVAGVTLNGNCE